MKNSCFTNRDVSLAYQVRTGRGMLTSDGIALLIVTACCCSVARMLLSWLVLNLTRMRLPGSDGRIGRRSVHHKTISPRPQNGENQPEQFLVQCLVIQELISIVPSGGSYSEPKSNSS